jgi:hypothetical protein
MKTPVCEKIEEGSNCPECEGKMIIPRVVNCSCHISAPCSACVNNLLTCNECGFEYEPAADESPKNEEKYRHVGGGIFANYFTHPSMDLGGGKRIFDYDYDSSSGSTMAYRGKYEGDVTKEDIIKALGDGTFGHRGPHLHKGQFTYVKITD